MKKHKKIEENSNTIIDVMEFLFDLIAFVFRNQLFIACSEYHAIQSRFIIIYWTQNVIDIK